MADLVNGMQNMSVQDSRYAPGNGGGGGQIRGAYIPPHLRAKMTQQTNSPPPQVTNGPPPGPAPGPAPGPRGGNSWAQQPQRQLGQRPSLQPKPKRGL
ncbi:hypothetical protein ABW21_db0204341 [Orbilia brochopaga]|nr:hypothetical protein ABW21_db0204341 [Drechslerella brochopaga]